MTAWLRWAALALVAVCATYSAESVSLGGARCGQLVCDRHQYCSTGGGHCEDCLGICDRASHNYEPSLCERSCQNYIHDLLFARKGDSPMGNLRNEEDMEAKIQSLQMKISIIIIIISIVLVLLLLVVGIKCFLFIKGNYKNFSWAWLRKKMQTPKKTPKMPTAEVAENKKPDNPSTTTASDAPTLSVFSIQTSNTPRRQPAEDTSLDFSYDNMALHLTPTTSGPRQPPGVAANRHQQNARM